MKKVTFATGSIFTSLLLISVLFKVMHWPFAGIALAISIGGLSLIFIPLFTIYQYNKNSNTDVKLKV